MKTQDGARWFRADVRKNNDVMGKGKIKLLESDTLDEKCYAVFANVIIDTNAGAERLLKEHGLIARDASVIITNVRTGNASRYTGVSLVEYKVMKEDMHAD